MVQAQRCCVNGVLLQQQQLRSETRRPVVPSERERERESESCWKKKSNAAAKNHAVAERKRRKRINTHINTLRTLLPNLSAGDKARVLTETVLYIKQLRKKAAEQEGGCCCCSSGSCLFILPGEKDEVQVNYINGGEDKLVLEKATICCEDRPNLNFDMANAVVLANGKVIKAEMATIGGRTKVMLVVQLCNQSSGDIREDVISLTKTLKAVTLNCSSAWAKHLSSKPLNNQWSPKSSMT